jgi:hypothetical protein
MRVLVPTALRGFPAHARASEVTAMNEHGKHPDQPEVNDPPPSETGGMRGDEVENLPAEGVPVDGGAEADIERPTD